MPACETRSGRASAILAALTLCTLAGTSALAAPDTDERPWLGVGIAGGASGVRIIEVIRDTPAEEAGIVVGDEIVAIAGARVTTPRELMTEIARYRIAEQVQVTVWRDGKTLRLSVILGPKLEPGEILYRRFVGRPAPPFDIDVVYGSDSGALGQLGGQVVVLQYFAMSCQECIDQHTDLSRLSDKHASDGLVVLAVDRDPISDIADWARRHAPSFNVARDSLGSMARAFLLDTTLPALIVIDRAGVVRYAGTGGADNLRRAVESVETLIRQSQRSR